jgi:hypothetical protein
VVDNRIQGLLMAMLRQGGVCVKRFIDEDKPITFAAVHADDKLSRTRWHEHVLNLEVLGVQPEDHPCSPLTHATASIILRRVSRTRGTRMLEASTGLNDKSHRETYQTRTRRIASIAAVTTNAGSLEISHRPLVSPNA